MKSKKRWLKVLLVLILLCSGLAPSKVFENTGLVEVVSAASTYTYTPSKTVAYADQYWSSYNSFYPDYNAVGGDCANFTSQCLHAGGLQMTAGWYHSATGIARTSSWTYASSLYTYLSKNCGTSVEIYKNSKKKSGYSNASGSKELVPSKIFHVGDAVFYYNNKTKRYSHATVCVGFAKDGTPLISAHNTNHSRVAWNLGSHWGHWAVVHISSKQTTGGQGAVPSSAVSYTGELWKSQVKNLQIYKSASTSSKKVTVIYKTSVLPVSERKTIGTVIWGKVKYGSLTGWCKLKTSSAANAVKISDGTGIKKVTVEKIKVSRISLNTASAVMGIGETKTLSVNYSPSDASQKKVDFTSSNGTIATVNSNGKITALKAGTAIITAKTVDGSNIKAKCKVTVCSEIYKVTSDAMVLRSGASVSSKKYGFKIAKGAVVCAQAVKETDDQTWIKVTYNKTTGWAAVKNKQTYAVKVSGYSGKRVTKLTLNKTSAVLKKKGKTVKLSVKSYTPSAPSLKGVLWSSSNTKVCKVSSSGKVTAVSKGTAIITAVAKDGSEVSAAAKITVKK